ncbi:Tho complex subunit 7-domain-containing protein [Zopfochytrium polystomum]|nr:Tho complex subunit 7-domain-containing protein [Zopfochytrium polystomum]
MGWWPLPCDMTRQEKGVATHPLLQAMSSSIIPLSEDAIHRNRLLVETRHLKKVVQRFRALQDAVMSGQHDKLQSALSQIRIELDVLELNVQKQIHMRDANLRDVEFYQEEKLRISKEMERAGFEIEELKAQLQKEQRIRQERQEYDALAVKINELPSREISQRNAAHLQADIAHIRAALAHHGQSLDRRRDLLKTVSTSIAGARTAIAADREQTDAETEARLEAVQATEAGRREGPMLALPDVDADGDDDADAAEDGEGEDGEGVQEQANSIKNSGGGMEATDKDGKAEDEEEEEGAIPARGGSSGGGTGGRFQREERMDVD